MDELESNIRCYGIQIPQNPFFDNWSQGSWGYPEDLHLGITYNISFDLEVDNCDVQMNKPDYSGLPPPLKPELFSFLGQDNIETQQTKVYAALAFSMGKEVAKLLRERLPEDMAAYLEKMTSFHAVYHDEDGSIEEGYYDGWEAYLLLNLPLDPTCNPPVNEVDYNDPDVPMGNRFIYFLADNDSDLEEEGSFSIYMVPQPGMVEADSYSGNMFTAPIDLVYWFSLDDNGYPALGWGSRNYRYDPFHMYPQCYIYADPEIIAKGSPSGEKQNLSGEDYEDERFLTDAMEWVRRAKESAAKNISPDTFREFLIERGFKELTDSGKPSTVPSYVKSVDTVAKEENLDWNGVAGNINRLVEEYDDNGPKAALGAKGHDTVINALKHFREFVMSLENPEQ